MKTPMINRLNTQEHDYRFHPIVFGVIAMSAGWACVQGEEAISTFQRLTQVKRLLRQPTFKTTSFPRNDVKFLISISYKFINR